MEIKKSDRDILSGAHGNAEEGRPCPECGTQMKEADRLSDGGFFFIWFQCSNDDCDGQWLQKKPRS